MHVVPMAKNNHPTNDVRLEKSMLPPDHLDSIASVSRNYHDIKLAVFSTNYIHSFQDGHKCVTLKRKNCESAHRLQKQECNDNPCLGGLLTQE